MKNPGARPRATVIGAGFTGLATAYLLERKGYSVEIYERAARAGGKLRTTRTEFGLAESGANAFLNSPRVEALFADLGVPLVAARRESRVRFIFRDGLARRWPLGFGATFRVASFLFRYLFKRRTVAPLPLESLSDYGRRVFGAEATEYLLLPAFQGIYAGDGNRLSASLLLAGLFSDKIPMTPKIRGSVSAAGGMGEVTTKLRERLESRGVKFHFRAPGPSGFPEHLTYYCGSASDTSEAVSRFAPELGRILSRIEAVPLVSLTAFFSADRRIRPGFGVLFPPRESFRSLGVLYNHVIFPGRVSRPDIHSETWILGGAGRPEAASLDDETLLLEVLEERGRLHGFPGPSEVPLHFVVHRWPKGIPYYTDELEGVLEDLSRLGPGSGNLRIMGNYLGGIGLAKILDRVADEIERIP